ncbi:hypothetical protein B6D52_02150 [Candidatus Parcubacteria bacterium 4484_255]|nr:MAG: hypothetical protein B6D52_02150 [Candidatus Parcubacteria bacterium 4484_255]
MSTRKNFIQATSILIGTIVGAGIFGLPYAFSKVGFIPSIFYLLFLGIVFLITKFCYAEVILRTKDDMEMSGYVRRYLGKNWQILITVSLILGIFSALIAYTIGVGQLLHAILGPVLGGNQVFWSLCFWTLASILVFKGIGIISKVELFMAFGLITIVLIVFGMSYSYIDINNLKSFHPENLFFPYGAVLFALGGATAIPTMRRILGNNVKLLKKAIILGLSVPILIYILFSLTVVGVNGESVSETAITGLAKATNNGILLIGGIFGVLAMTTSFLALGHILRELFQRDYKIPKFSAWALTVFTPLIVFLLGLRSFIVVISFAGGILSGIQGIALINSYYRARKSGDRKPEFSFNLAKPIAYVIYAAFLFGIVYQLIY